MSAESPRCADGAPHAPRWGKQGWSAALEQARRGALAPIVAAAVALLAAAVAFLAAAPVRADAGPPRTRVRLELTLGSGTERCPDERFLRAETARHMGFDPFDAEAPLTMVASIEREQGELLATMYLRARGGRELWADGFGTRGDCTTLVSAMALSIAAQLGNAARRPSAQGPPAAPESPATPLDEACSPERPCAGQPAPPPGKAPPAPPSRDAAPRSNAPPAAPSRNAAPARELPSVRAPPLRGAGQAAAERFRWTVGAGAMMAVGLTPGVALGPTLSLAGRWPQWSVALEARGLASLSTNVADVRAAMSALTTNAALCLHRHVLFACGVGELGVLRAVPEVPWSPASLLGFRAGIGARAGITWAFSESLSGYGHTEAVQRLVDWSLLRHEGITESERTVWSAPAIGLAFGMGLQLNL